MSNKYRICLLNKNSNTRFPINYLSISAKTYFEENSSYVDEWDWGSPSRNYDDYTQLFEEVANENPTVVGFSVYVWNESFVAKFAEQLKQRLPNVIIIYGGPQNRAKYDMEFFKKNPFIDLILPGDAYGEVSIHDILNNISTNNGKLVGSEIDYAYYPDRYQLAQFNPLTIKKKDFKWPKNPFRAQEHLVKPLLEKITDVEARWICLETSRGCPYKCSFCDWGGGTYTKTVKKPYETVLDEITWASENGIMGIYFMDANFGLFDIDIEYVQHIVAEAKKNQYPKRVMVQPTKSKIHNMYAIYKELVQADLLAQYLICLQDLDDNVKKNVDRIDFSFEDQAKMFKELQQIKYLPIAVDYILGLPGSSITTIKTAIHRFSLQGIGTPLGYYWSLLPETPAYAKEYREKFKILTIDKKHSSATGTTLKLKHERSNDRDPGVNMSLDDGTDMSSEYVIGSYSYTPEDWVEMNMLLLVTTSTQSTKILDKIADYLWDEHQIEYGTFFQTLTDTLLRDETINPVTRNNYRTQLQALFDWMYDSSKDTYCDYDSDYPFSMSPPVYLLFVALIDIDNVFDAVKIAINKLIDIDDKIVDLCHYSRNITIDISYRPGRTFTTKYDWINYFNCGELIQSPKQYKITDTQMIAGGKWYDIDWEQYEGSKNYFTHYIYRACYDHRSSVSAFNIIEI
jgi:putative methyltransferase